MKKWNRILAAALSLSMVGGSALSSPVAVYGAEDQALDPDPAAENSWRYSDGQPVSMPSTYTDDPNAWEKVDGQFVNSNGEVIPGAVMKGIDVSEHNGEIDWEKVKNDGIDFAIIRCGYGQDMESQDDDYWEANVEACEALGIPYGVYLYSYADTLEKAQSEAQHVLRLLEGHDPAYPVYYDLEDNITLELSDSMKTQVAATFCNIITDNGYEAGVYSSLYWWNDYLTDPVFNNWSRWVAQWNPTCDYQGEYELWQCSSTGQVDGIEGNVDLNFLMDPDTVNTAPGTEEEPGHVLYSTHAQTYGWLDEVSDGAVSGTTGEQKRLEAIAIKLSSGTEGGVQYSTHVQTYGWQEDWKPSKSSLREPQLRIMIFIIPYMLRPLAGWDGPRTENRQALPGMLNVWRPLRSSWFQKAESLLELQRTLIWKMRKKLSRLHLWNTALMYRLMAGRILWQTALFQGLLASRNV